MGRMLDSGMDAQYWEEWSVLGRMLRTRKDAWPQEDCSVTLPQWQHPWLSLLFLLWL